MKLVYRRENRDNNGKALRHQEKKLARKILKKMSKLERKLGKYQFEANCSDNSSASSSSDSRRHRSRSRGCKRSRRHRKHGNSRCSESHARSSSSDSTSSSSSSSSSSRSPSPPRHPHHHHHHHHPHPHPHPHIHPHPHPHPHHHHGPPHLNRSRSFNGRPSGPPFPWMLGSLDHAQHGFMHRRGREHSRHYKRHRENGLQGWFAYTGEQSEPNGRDASSADRAREQARTAGSANVEEAAAASNAEEMDEDVAVEFENIASRPEEGLAEQGPQMNDSQATDWTEIIQTGLSKDRKASLMKKHPVSINCPLLRAPKVNKEILPLASKATVKKDIMQMEEQNKIGIGLTALSKAMSDLESLKNVSHDLPQRIITTTIYDTCKEATEIILDVHRDITLARQASMTAELHRRIRPYLANCKPDSYLYGMDFGEKVKDVKCFKKGQKKSKCKSNEDKEKATTSVGESGPSDKGSGEHLLTTVNGKNMTLNMDS